MYAELNRKRCSRCRKSFDLDSFNNNRSNKDGKDTYCRPCKSIIKKLDYVKNREKIKRQVHESYKRNRDKCIARANKYRTENRERVLAQKRFASIGITKDQYDAKLKEQDECCAICGIHQSARKYRLSADHCHVSGKLRGLLCGFCNTAIGLFKEDKRNLYSAIQYLEHWEKI